MPNPDPDDARARLAHGLEPLSYAWASDRGVSIHRHYLRDFLERHAADVRGEVLEFNDPGYTREIGRAKVTRSDVLHIDDTNPLATIVADLTRPNTLESDRFDCVICTHVLHIVFELGPMVRELYRVLKPGGVLLVAVPTVSMIGPQFPELWRFTPLGLRRTLEGAFAPEAITVEAFGNSLTAAAELRGLTVDELTPEELAHHDGRFALEVCARAVK